ncbi:MAG: NAD-dependent epimerase/dehydratase family protein [Thermoleophilaceae bacterium]
MKVLVTGASGFIGRAACAELKERGHDVVALVRRPGSEPPGTTPVHGDLRDAESLDKAIAEAKPDAVAHLAAEIGSQRNAKKIEAVNIEGMQRLIDACKAAGSPKVVFVSTVVTGDPKGELLEEDKPLPVETPYGRSKQEGERMLRESGLPHAVIRPGHVYGPGGWYAEEIVARLKQPGRFVVVGKGDNWWDMVRVEDVAAAIADAAERADDGAVYHVADDEPLTMYDFVALTADALGVGKPRRVPVAVARLAAGAGPVAATVRSARTSNARIKRELGWSPRFATAREGVPDAVAKLSDA